MIVFRAAQADPHKLMPSPMDVARRRLRNSPYLPVRSVSCEYHQGILFLRGQLPSYFLKQIAQETVAKLDGVVRVSNEIEVHPPIKEHARCSF